MTSADIIGTTGVGLILAAYFLHTFRLLGQEVVFFMLNTAGAALACYASWLIRYWPFVALEATWTLVSIAGLLKYIYQYQRNERRNKP